MTYTEYENRLQQIKRQEDLYDVKIRIKDIIDKDHLNCIWYRGEIGTIKYRDCVILIEARGDISVFGTMNGVAIDIRDKGPYGNRVYDELGSTCTDARLARLLDSLDDNNRLHILNNNWFEFNILTPEGEFIDMGSTDNVLGDNLLECFENIFEYVEYVDWFLSET